MNPQQHNLTRTWAAHRVHIYVGCVIFGIFVTLIPLLGVGLGYFSPATTYWVWGVLDYVVLLVPLATAWWDAPGENRTTLERAFEFTMIWFPVTASSQITWETPWMTLDRLGPMHGAGPQNHWLWLWWGYGAADSRYLTSDPGLLGMELVAILGGCILLVAFIKLFKARREHNEEKLIRPLWVAFFCMSMMLAVVTIYFASEGFAGFADIHEGFWGFAYKFIFMNIWWLIVPLIALPFTYKIISYLYKSTLTKTIDQRSG